MSRTIKFRAWVKYTTDHRWEWAYKKAEEKLSTNQNLDDDATRIRSEFMDEWDKNNPPESRYSHKEYMTNLDEVSISLSGRLTRRINVEVLNIMQFTGLNDKSGKEIYEGDILAERENLKRTGQVVYEPAVAAFMILVDGGYCHLNEGDWGRGEQLKYTEVIGNIYENPELLGAK